MDPSRALPNALGPALLAALRTPASEGQVQALLAQLGQELDLVLFAVGRDSVKLRLPSGQVFEAAGELPYPAGTRLTVQVQPPSTEGGAPRLKLIEAAAPPAPAILAPLVQGEAAPLMARLLQAEVPPGLQPLLRILESLQDPARPQAPPASRILAALETLPAPALQALRQVAPGPTATLPELAQALRNWIATTFLELPAQVPPASAKNSGPAAPSSQTRTASPPEGSTLQAVPLEVPPAPASAPPTPGIRTPTASPPTIPRTPAPAPAPLPAGTAPPTGTAESRPRFSPIPGPSTLTPAPEGSPPAGSQRTSADPFLWQEPAGVPQPLDPAGFLLQRLEAQWSAQGEPAAEAWDPIRALVRQLLKGLETPSPAPDLRPLPAPAVPRPPAPAQAGEVGHPPLPHSAPKLAALEGLPSAPLEHAESWETWIGGAIRTLADPRLSPREAPFHLAQAREGTAFFEVPLPWGSAPLQIWIESGLPESQEEPFADAHQKVLVGLALTALGETRVGLQRVRGTLQVRIWTERPELLVDRLPRLRQELEEGGSRVDLKVLPMGDGLAAPPSLRAVLAGSAFQALG